MVFIPTIKLIGSNLKEAITFDFKECVVAKFLSSRECYPQLLHCAGFNNCVTVFKIKHPVAHNGFCTAKGRA